MPAKGPTLGEFEEELLDQSFSGKVLHPDTRNTVNASADVILLNFKMTLFMSRSFNFCCTNFTALKTSATKFFGSLGDLGLFIG